MSVASVYGTEVADQSSPCLVLYSMPAAERQHQCRYGSIKSERQRGSLSRMSLRVGHEHLPHDRSPSASVLTLASASPSPSPS